MKHERVRLGDCYQFENKLNYTASPCLKNYKTNNKKDKQKNETRRNLETSLLTDYGNKQWITKANRIDRISSSWDF